MASLGTSAIMRPSSAACASVDVRHRRDVLLGDQQEVHGRPRMDVVEGEHSSSS
jgi:hypothetical protein